MWLGLLAGCGTNWFGAWDFAHFALSAPDGSAELIHGDAGWIECDDRGDCQLLRRYDLDLETLTVIPRERVTVEYATAADEDVLWSWGGALQLQLDVSASSQTVIVLEGDGVALEPSPWQVLSVRMELVR